MSSIKIVNGQVWINGKRVEAPDEDWGAEDGNFEMSGSRTVVNGREYTGVLGLLIGCCGAIMACGVLLGLAAMFTSPIWLTALIVWAVMRSTHG